MRGCSLLISIIASTALGSFAHANNPGDVTRVEKLAWHIEAYVPCDAGGKINALKAEVASFEATREEVVGALDYILVDENACGSLKKASADLLELAQEQPGKFDATFGFVADQDVLGNTEVASGANDGVTQTTESVALMPPQASTLKTSSSY